MRSLALAGVVFVSCGGAPASPPSQPRAERTAPAAAPVQEVDAGPVPRAAPASVPDASVPGLITDEECIARGGRVETEQTWAHERRRDRNAPVQPYRVCRIPSTQNGSVCRGDGDCGSGRCFCTGDLSGPDVARRLPQVRARDGTPATGVCSDGHLPSGSWFCLVEDGRVVLHGIIID